MSLSKARAFVLAFDVEQDKNIALELVRQAAEEVSGLTTPLAQEVRAYCQVVGGLCDMYMTGPSHFIAETIEDGGKNAAAVNNHKLAVFANWYGGCCRLARAVVRGGNTDDMLALTAERLLHVAEMARIQNMRRLCAVASATRVECFARMSDRPGDFDEQLQSALTLLGGVAQSDIRVAERTRLLRHMRKGSFEIRAGGQSQMPTITRTYLTLMHKPGDLISTFRAS